MATPTIHVGDVGTVLRAEVKDEDGGVVNLAGASALVILLLKPDGTSLLTKTAVLYTDGADGIMQYVTIDGDLDQPGLWRIQAHVSIAGGDWHGEVAKFRVSPNIG